MRRSRPGAEEPWSVTIVKEKTLQEKTGFKLGAAAAMLLAAALVTLLLLRRQEVRAAKQQEKERISKELDMAAGIQTSMLHHRFPAFPDRQEFELLASMDPAKEVGGDFYDFFLVDDDHLALVVADVSGKGIPAALFMMVSMTLLRGSAETLRSPAAILNEVNAQLCEGNKNNMFVTVWLGILELSTGRLVFSDGGHEKPVLFHEGTWSFINKRSGVALGLMEPELLELEDEPAYVDQELQLQPGDVLLQYTDGVPEATDAKEQLYGEQRLLAALHGSESTAPDAILPRLRRSIDDFVKGAPQFDDITLLALRYRGRETEETA